MAVSNGFTYTISAGNATITAYDPAVSSYGYNVVIPATLDGYSVTSIANYAFYTLNLDSVTINHVITLGYSVFGDNGILSVTLNSNVNFTSYNYPPFDQCTIGDNLFITNNVTIIRMGFFNNAGLTSVNIPSSVVTIEHDAFYYNPNLASFTVNNTNCAFSNYVLDDCMSALSKGNIYAPDPSTAKTWWTANYTGTYNFNSIVPTPVNVDGQCFFYNGTNLSGMELTIGKGWQIEERINNISIMTFDIVNAKGQTIENGKECYFYDKNYNLLHGGILTYSKDREDIQNKLYYNCRLEDFTRIANQPKAKIVYENKTIDYIVKDLRTRYLANTTDSNYNFLISEGTIEADLPTLNYIAFNYLTVSECFNKLCQFGNYIWNIDKNKALHFHTIGYVVSSIPFVRGTTKFLNMSRTRNMDNYRNYQIVKGSPYIGSLRINEIPTPPGDGNIKTYTTKFPIAEAPMIEVSSNSGVTWTEKTVGVLGLDSDSDFDYLWTYNSQQFSQNDSGVALNYATGDRIRITYKPLIPLLIIYKNTAEITNRGLHEHYVENTLLQNKYDALTYARNLIEKYAEISDTISFDLYSHDYNTMEQMSITDSLRGMVSETFLVESCIWRSDVINHANLVYTYTVMDGSELGGWEEFFKNLLQPEKITLDDNEVVIDLKESEETHNHDGEYDITIYDDLLYPLDTLYPSNSLYPNNSSSSADNVTD